MFPLDNVHLPHSVAQALLGKLDFYPTRNPILRRGGEHILLLNMFYAGYKPIDLWKLLKSIDPRLSYVTSSVAREACWVYVRFDFDSRPVRVVSGLADRFVSVGKPGLWSELML